MKYASIIRIQMMKSIVFVEKDAHKILAYNEKHKNSGIGMRNIGDNF